MELAAQCTTAASNPSTRKMSDAGNGLRSDLTKWDEVRGGNKASNDSPTLPNISATAQPP